MTKAKHADHLLVDETVDCDSPESLSQPARNSFPTPNKSGSRSLHNLLLVIISRISHKSLIGVPLPITGALILLNAGSMRM